MIINNNTETIRSVSGITPEQEENMRFFIQGAVYCWCKNKPDEWFAARSLFGGENYFWNGTPLIDLYQKNLEQSGDDEAAVKQAGRECGVILKTVLKNDKRKFELREGFRTLEYHWIPDENDEIV